MKTYDGVILVDNMIFKLCKSNDFIEERCLFPC